MGYLVLPLIIGIVSLPMPTPPPHQLADLARIQRAINREVYLRDTSGQERVVSILGVGTDAVTIAVGTQWMTVPRDAILAVDGIQDSNRDGVIKGALIGLILGWAAESTLGNGQGRYLLRGAVTYGTLGYLFDRNNIARQPLYRAP